MPDIQMHGPNVIEVNDGVRAIRTVNTSVIGIVGTAPDADAEVFPYNVPVLVPGSREKAAKLDTTGNKAGTLPSAMDDIFAEIGAAVVVIRVPEGADDAETVSNMVGNVAADGSYSGVEVLRVAPSIAKVKPRILVAPGFSHHKPIADKLVAVADATRSFTYIDPNGTNDADVITYRESFGSRRAQVYGVNLERYDTSTNSKGIFPVSASVAGLRAKIDATEGFWTTISNHELHNVQALSRPIAYELGSSSDQAHFLNVENEVALVVHENGYRTWGNRTCAADQKYAFEPIVRTADAIADSIKTNHLWAVDRGITKTYVTDVQEGVDAYLSNLKSLGGIAGGKCWVNKELNTPINITQGKVYWDFDFTGNFPAENPIFRMHLTDEYIKEIF